MMDYFQWDGETHLEDTELWKWLVENKPTAPTLESYCDCFHLKGCCSLVLDGQKVRAGDRIYSREGVLELVRGDTQPLICPTHNVEHTGTGPYLCITTGENT